jgi:tRNA U55 pseudouridine synthase TruB
MLRERVICVETTTRLMPTYALPQTKELYIYTYTFYCYTKSEDI